MPNDFNVMGPSIIQGADRFGAALTEGFLRRKATQEARDERELERQREDMLIARREAQAALDRAERERLAREAQRQTNIKYVKDQADELRGVLRGTGRRTTGRTTALGRAPKPSDYGLSAPSAGTIPMVFNKYVTDEETGATYPQQVTRPVEEQQKLMADALRAQAGAIQEVMGGMGAGAAPAAQPGLAPEEEAMLRELGYALKLTDDNMKWLGSASPAVSQEIGTIAQEERHGRVPEGTTKGVVDRVRDQTGTARAAMANALDEQNQPAITPESATQRVAMDYAGQEGAARFANDVLVPEIRQTFEGLPSGSDPAAVTTVDAAKYRLKKAEERNQEAKRNTGGASAQAQRDIREMTALIPKLEAQEKRLKDTGDSLMEYAAAATGLGPEETKAFMADQPEDDMTPGDVLLAAHRQAERAKQDSLARFWDSNRGGTAFTPTEAINRAELNAEALYDNILRQRMQEYLVNLQNRAIMWRATRGGEDADRTGETTQPASTEASFPRAPRFGPTPVAY